MSDANPITVPSWDEFENNKFTPHSGLCSDAIPKLIANMTLFTRWFSWLYEQNDDGEWVISDAAASAIRAIKCYGGGSGGGGGCEEIALTAQATPGNTTMDLKFTGDKLRANDPYKIERKLGAGAYSQIYPTSGWATASSPTITYHDTGLTNDSEYTWRLTVKRSGCPKNIVEVTAAPIECLNLGLLINVDVNPNPNGPPNFLITVTGSITSGMEYAIEATADGANWLQIKSGITTSTIIAEPYVLSVPITCDVSGFNPNEFLYAVMYYGSIQFRAKVAPRAGCSPQAVVSSGIRIQRLGNFACTAGIAGGRPVVAWSAVPGASRYYVCRTVVQSPQGISMPPRIVATVRSPATGWADTSNNWCAYYSPGVCYPVYLAYSVIADGDGSIPGRTAQSVPVSTFTTDIGIS